MARIISFLIAALLFAYILVAAVFFKDVRNDVVCHGLQIIVTDSLDKHFVTESDLISLLKRAEMNPIEKQMNDINTEAIEAELMKNEMIAKVEVYKTPSGLIKLEVSQKIPILRIMSPKGNFYVDNNGSTMPISRRYVVHVPIASGQIEKEFAVNELYNFALFLQKNEFWNDQIEQIYVHANNDVELIPRVGNHRILLGHPKDYKEKLDNLQLFYKQAIPKIGWDKYSVINLKYKNQIVCTKK